MMERTQVDLEGRDSCGMTALISAAQHGHLPELQYLIGQGADKEARAGDGCTPLHWAAGNGRLPVVQYLSRYVNFGLRVP